MGGGAGVTLQDIKWHLAGISQMLSDNLIRNAYYAAKTLEAHNKVLREACAAVLCSDQPDCPSFKEAKQLCVKALQITNE